MQLEKITGRTLLDLCRQDFNAVALDIYQYQYAQNSLYRRYNELLHIQPGQVKTIGQIPFLPISFFKTHKVISGSWTQEELLFESSGTTGEVPSRHYVKDNSVYHVSLTAGFQAFYGDPADYVILALLPSYLERGHSSLVHMAKELMALSGHPENGFYLNEWEQLATVLQRLAGEGRKILLLGVTFALLDFAAAYPMPLGNTIVMETGGMKGRREEWTREQVHEFLQQQWQLKEVHSEYGMTELLSQAYAFGGGIFEPALTMQVRVRDLQDPFDIRDKGTGALNIIDLANIHSCSFIATEDIGRLHEGQRFEVLGRMDHVALRGCSLMAV
jgi:hypothetical protein